MDKATERILEQSAKQGLSDQELCRILNAKKDKIYTWKTGRSTPSVEEVAIIAERLNVSTDYLLGRTDNPSPTEPALEGDNLKFALFGTTDITDEVMDDVRRYAEFVAQRKRERGAP